MMTNTGNRVTQGQFSFLPDLTDAQITAQIKYALKQRLGRQRRVHRRSASAQYLLGDVRQPDVRPQGSGRDPAGDQRLPARPFPITTSASWHSTPRAAWRAPRMSFIVNRPDDRAGVRAHAPGGGRPRHPLHRALAMPPTSRRANATEAVSILRLHHGKGVALAVPDERSLPGARACGDIRTNRRSGNRPGGVVPAMRISRKCSTSSTASWSG